MTEILLCCVLPLHLVLPWVTVQQTKSFTPKVKYWQVQSTQERELYEETALFVPLQYPFPPNYVLVVKAILESFIFPHKKESQVFSG